MTLTRLWIGGLPESVDEEWLRRRLTGAVEVELPPSKVVGQCRGFGFATVPEQNVEALIKRLHRSRFRGNVLQLARATPSGVDSVRKDIAERSAQTAPALITPEPMPASIRLRDPRTRKLITVDCRSCKSQRLEFNSSGLEMSKGFASTELSESVMQVDDHGTKETLTQLSSAPLSSDFSWGEMQNPHQQHKPGVANVELSSSSFLQKPFHWDDDVAGALERMSEAEDEDNNAASSGFLSESSAHGVAVGRPAFLCASASAGASATASDVKQSHASSSSESSDASNASNESSDSSDEADGIEESSESGDGDDGNDESDSSQSSNDGNDESDDESSDEKDDQSDSSEASSDSEDQNDTDEEDNANAESSSSSDDEDSSSDDVKDKKEAGPDAKDSDSADESSSSSDDGSSSSGESTNDDATSSVSSGSSAAEEPKPTKQSLLSDSDSESHTDMNLHERKEFLGPEGRELMTRERGFGGDERFRMDERFRELDADTEMMPVEQETDDVKEEKQSALNVLGKIFGEKFEAKEGTEKNSRWTLKRFDPSNPAFELKDDEGGEKQSEQEESSSDEEDEDDAERRCKKIKLSNSWENLWKAPVVAQGGEAAFRLLPEIAEAEAEKPPSDLSDSDESIDSSDSEPELVDDSLLSFREAVQARVIVGGDQNWDLAELSTDPLESFCSEFSFRFHRHESEDVLRENSFQLRKSRLAALKNFIVEQAERNQHKQKLYGRQRKQKRRRNPATK